MKAISETQAADHHKDGSWSDATLDSLFKSTASAHPDRLAIADAPDRADWTGGEPRSLSYAEADKEIDRLAAFYGAVGLTADHVIGIQSPNTVDTVIAFLAALRADLIVSPLPLHWRQKNVLEALNSIGAKGFIAADRVETRMVGADARDVAADLFSLRFVFGLGKDVPDGLIELGPMLAEMGDGLTFTESDRSEAADHTATVSWSRSGGETVPVTRCHNHWISAAKLALAETELGDGAKLLVPYSLSGLTGLGGGLVPWLLCGGSLHLHHPTSLVRLAKHANEVDADYVLTPGPLAQMLDKGVANKSATIAAAWNIAAPPPSAFEPIHPMVDLHIADEFALVARKRSHATSVEAVPLGKQTGSNGRESGPALLDIAVDTAADGETPKLLVKGPAVPGTEWRNLADNKCLSWTKEGYLETGILVEPVDGGLAGFGIPGAYAPGAGQLDAIDALYMTYPGLQEAAAFLVEDDIIGARLYAALVPSPGNVPDAKAFFAFLDAAGVDLAQIPFRVLILQSLPRDQSSEIDRSRLTLRTQRLAAQVA
ncbi:class I adenylate-forming enzyme family protein [Roseibium polysiphoniae]|uniref:class I adenylate-forming enzyme family protein n=1 Tax=Roseibium polysiphoniae TaxID=2571221 RepID=UPI003299E133